MMINAGGKMFHRLPVFFSGANYIYSFCSLHRPGKRSGAQLDGNSLKTIKTDTIRNRSVLIERAVHIDDLKNLEFEGQSLSTVFSEREWKRILEAKGKVYEEIVYDFYDQLRNSDRVGLELPVFVRQVKVVISPTEIASFLHLPPKHPNPRSSQHHADGKIHRAVTGTERLQHHDVNEVISVKDMLPFFQMLHHIVAANIKPTNQTMDISFEQGKFLLNIARGVDIDLPKHIFETIKKAAASRSFMECLPFGQLITGLSLRAGVKPWSNEKEVEPVDPIPLIKPITQTLPSGFDVMLLENKIKSSVIAELVAPIQRELKGMDSRLKALEDRIQELHRSRYT